MNATHNDPLDFLSRINNAGGKNAQTDQIQALLYEIMRVKELVRYYEEIPNGAGKLGASILNELVSEAYQSLVNYDPELIRKYYDLLLNCD
jgi:hypothetical protein